MISSVVYLCFAIFQVSSVPVYGTSTWTKNRRSRQVLQNGFFHVNPKLVVEVEIRARATPLPVRNRLDYSQSANFSVLMPSGSDESTTRPASLSPFCRVAGSLIAASVSHMVRRCAGPRISPHSCLVTNVSRCHGSTVAGFKLSPLTVSPRQW